MLIERGGFVGCVTADVAGHGLIDFAELEELSLSQRRHNPALHDQNPGLHFGLVARFHAPCRDHRHADPEHLAWAREFAAAMQPHATGVYVNNLGVEGADRVKAAYAPATYGRLVALKNAYDPTNVFRLNQNITP